MATYHYETLGPLLSGTGSRAYLALRISHKAEPVVLVWLPPEVAAQPDMVAEVEKETRRAVLLDHPNIVRVFELTKQQNGTGRVVEYVDGESLRRVLEIAQRLPPTVAARMVADAALGTHYAHLAGNDDGSPLIHGDLRPETLLVSFRGLTKVSGYGALAVAPKKPGDRRVRGRRSHSAPEQVVGGRSAANVTTDVYLLGALLYECLAGNPPFSDEPDFEKAVLTLPLPALSEEVCPPGLNHVLQRAMAKRAADRYPSALAFREALESALNPLPSHQALAEYLKALFPEDDPARMARLNMLEKGLATFMPPADLSLPPEAEIPEGVPPARSKGLSTAIKWIGSALVVGAAFVAVRVMRHKSSRTVATPAAYSAAPVATSSGSPRENAPVPTPAPAPQVLAPQPTEGLSDAGGEATPVQSWRFSLHVEPSVEVMVDGIPRGRSPVTLMLSAGPHLFQFMDLKQGINTSRTLTVGRKHRSESIYLSRGYVNVLAPRGSDIFIDGKPHGKAPQREIGVYEGSHKLVVNLSGAKWQKSFEAHPNERMSFTVNFN